ncbi:hypothetical protein BJV77DRAFT_1066008 [Russula vinacea]|nr:hypothetical protein BJV77DRAFT_1066008 [Russula vinacea]
MPPSYQQPARLTKKQKKATAFRERGSNSRVRASSSQQTLHPDAHDPTPPVKMLTAMTTTTTRLTRCLPWRMRIKLWLRWLEMQRAMRRAMRRVVPLGSEAEDHGGVHGTAEQEQDQQEAEDGGGWGGPARAATRKKARLARGSQEVLPPGEEDGAASLNAVTDGDGSKRITKRAKRSAERIKGNLKYTTTREAIQNHFSLCGAPTPTVRLLTPKVTRAGATTVAKSNKSKGCAFLEFTARPALQAALRLHQSELDGRRINVELTAGVAEKAMRGSRKSRRGTSSSRRSVCVRPSFSIPHT